MCLRVPALYSTVVHLAAAHVMYAGCCELPTPVHFV